MPKNFIQDGERVRNAAYQQSKGSQMPEFISDEDMHKWDHISDSELASIAAGTTPAPADDLSHLSDEQLEAIAAGKAPDFISDEQMAKMEAASNGGPLNLRDLGSYEVIHAPDGAARPLNVRDLGGGVEVLHDPTKPAPLSGLDSALINASQGATLGFGDEIVAGLRTATDTVNPFNKDATIHNVGARYDSNLADERSQLAQAREEHPLASFAGGIGGGAAGAIATGGASGATGLIRSGATIGAVQGFGEGEGGLENRVESGAKGATIGAAFGAALKGVGGLSKATLNALSKYFDTETLQAAAIGASKADLKRGAGAGSVKDAIKTFDEIGVFRPKQGSAVPPSLEEIRDHAQSILDHGAEQVKSIIERVDHVAPRTTAANIDLSDVIQLRDNLARNVTDKGSANAVNEIHALLGNLEERFARDPQGLPLSELQEFKQTLQNRIVELGGYGPGEAPRALVEAMESIAAKVKNRIETVSDQVLPKQERGLVKMYNKGQSAALTLLPKIDSKLAGEALRGTKAPSSFSNVLKYAGASVLGGPVAGLGLLAADAAVNSTQGQLARAALPRTVKGLKEMLPRILPTLSEANPGMAAQVGQMLTLPDAKMAGAMQPLMQEFSQYFAPSPYPSLLDGRLHDPADIEAHRSWIENNVSSLTEKAKSLSALNKDGTILGGPTQ